MMGYSVEEILEGIDTETLMTELIIRLGKKNCVEIQTGKIMQVAFYPDSNYDNKFRVSRESMATKEFDNARDAVVSFMKMHKGK